MCPGCNKSEEEPVSVQEYPSQDAGQSTPERIALLRRRKSRPGTRRFSRCQSARGLCNITVTHPPQIPRISSTISIQWITMCPRFQCRKSMATAKIYVSSVARQLRRLEWGRRRWPVGCTPPDFRSAKSAAIGDEIEPVPAGPGAGFASGPDTDPFLCRPDHRPVAEAVPQLVGGAAEMQRKLSALLSRRPPSPQTGLAVSGDAAMAAMAAIGPAGSMDGDGDPLGISFPGAVRPNAAPRPPGRGVVHRNAVEQRAATRPYSKAPGRRHHRRFPHNPCLWGVPPSRSGSRGPTPG